MSRLHKRINQSTVMNMTGFTEAALTAAVKSGVFPAPVHTGKQTLWLAFDVVDWLIDNVVSAAYLRKRLENCK
jgi:predicted DNA-binding transcriptional regulator AlpA